MGKLRKLRKAVLANPERWRGNGARMNWFGESWYPDRWVNSYRTFVTHVLREVGKSDVRTVREGGVAAPVPQSREKPV